MKKYIKKKMGLNVGMNALTSGGLVLATILLVVMGILLVSAASKVREIPEFEASRDLKKADNDLKTAYILIFIAAGVTLLLAVAYGGHEVAWCPSEWIHSLIYLIVVALLVIGIIYAYIVLNDLYTPELEDRNGSDAFIWASLLIGAFAFMVVLATGSGRIGYNVSRGDVRKRFQHAEKKIHETHSHVTGQPLEYEEPVNRCCPEPEPPCGPAPMLVTTPQLVQRSVPAQRPVRLPQVANSNQQYVGPQTVTRHSVVTTSQPMVSTTSSNLGLPTPAVQSSEFI